MPDPSRLLTALCELRRETWSIPGEHQGHAATLRRLLDSVLVEIECWGLDVIAIMDAAEALAMCQCHERLPDGEGMMTTKQLQARAERLARAKARAKEKYDQAAQAHRQALEELKAAKEAAKVTA